MKMRNLLISISAFVVASLCVASVAMADLARVNIVMDVSDPYNVTLTNYEENGTYGGAYFAVDACEVYGPMTAREGVGPGSQIQTAPPFVFRPHIYQGIMPIYSDYVWMAYGESYYISSSIFSMSFEGSLVANSSDPDDFYAMHGDEIYPRSFIVVDVIDNNGLGAVKFLGTIVPEPASMGLLAVGALAIIRRRRK